MPINSNNPGEPPLTALQWIGLDNSWLIIHGYPPHAGPTTQTQPFQTQAVPPHPQAETVLLDPINFFDSKSPVKARPKSINKIYNIPFYEAFRNRVHSPREEGEIGLEIEAEGMNLFMTPISWWVTHPDGSLRSVKDHPPIEYVLRKPIARADVPKALSYLTKKLKETGSNIVESHRTSVHVHVNCQELTIKQIYQYWCLYTVFEEMLVDFSGPDRPGNLFCLSTKQAEYAVTCLEQAIQNENFNDVFSDNLRYTSCNTASLGKFGSLEFRSMRGTVDQDLIQVWVDILLLLRDKALEYNCPRSIVEDFTRLGPEAFLNKVFSSRSDIRGIFLSRPLIERNKSMWEGLRLMKDVAYAIVWEKRVVEDKKKEAPEDLSPADDVYEGFMPGWYPIEMVTPELWVLSNDQDTRIVNFSQGTVSVDWRQHPGCHFASRRWWRVTEDFEFASGPTLNTGAIVDGCYPPNE